MVMFTFVCCLADQYGNFFGHQEIVAPNLSDAMALGWELMDGCQSCKGITIFKGEARVFSNAPKKAYASLASR